MNAVSVGSLLAVSLLAVACASRTRAPRQTTAQQRSMPTLAAAPPSMNEPSPSALQNVAPSKRKLLQSAMISEAFGGCWDATRHATIHAEMVAEDGTPYFAPHVLSIDLNGDGAIDPVVEVDRDSNSVRYELYLNRGNCAQHLGTMRVGGTIVGPMGKANGLRTLEIMSLCDGIERPCRDIEHTELFFDGKGWRAGKQWTMP